jgi:hypothetical protein
VWTLDLASVLIGAVLAWIVGLVAWAIAKTPRG